METGKEIVGSGRRTPLQKPATCSPASCGAVSAARPQLLNRRRGAAPRAMSQCNRPYLELFLISCVPRVRLRASTFPARTEQAAGNSGSVRCLSQLYSTF